MIFELYATGEYGLRKLSRELTRRGYTSLLGNDFNTVTIGHILTNPKYKGWYCGNKTQSLDYRTKKKAFLEENEWVMYPDPNIPAIVSEELWDKANAIFKERSARTKAYGVGYQSRYPYSGKIICGKHGTTFHRQSFETKAGKTEFWKCKTYRTKGKAGCDMPSIRTTELDMILADLFQKLVTHQKEIVQLVLHSIEGAEKKVDNAEQIARLVSQIQQLEQKKDKLLELSIADAISMKEFKSRNNRFNEQITDLQEQVVLLQKQESQNKITQLDPALLEKALWEELRFENGIESELVSTILDHVVVCEGSNNKQVYLEIYLRLGGQASVHFSRDPFVLCDVSSRSTTPRAPIRRI